MARDTEAFARTLRVKYGHRVKCSVNVVLVVFFFSVEYMRTHYVPYIVHESTY